LNIKSHSGNLK